MPYNLSSPSTIMAPCDPTDLMGWFEREIQHVPTSGERGLLLDVARQLDTFVKWPTEPLLLWHGCNRVPEQGKRQKYFVYPESIKLMAKEKRVRLDTRPNGPAIAAFLLAGGERPARSGSSNAWSIHHLYSGKFPYLGRNTTVHAAKHDAHFTQSAGLVAVHPVADALVDEFPSFAWLLRGHAYVRSGYDPDSVFSQKQTKLGFAVGFSCKTIDSAATTAGNYQTLVGQC